MTLNPLTIQSSPSSLAVLQHLPIKAPPKKVEPTKPVKKAASKARQWKDEEDQIIVDAALRGETHGMIPRLLVARSQFSVEQRITRLVGMDREDGIVLPSRWKLTAKQQEQFGGGRCEAEWTLEEDEALVLWRLNGCIGLVPDVFDDSRSKESMRARLDELELAQGCVTEAEVALSSSHLSSPPHQYSTLHPRVEC